DPLELDPAPEHRVGHRDLDRREQVIAAAAEDIVVADGDLGVEVAVRAAARTGLTLARQLPTHAGVDARGYLDPDRLRCAHPALALAGRARVRDERAVAAAGPARRGGDDRAEQRSHLALHVPGSAADVARDRARPGLRARAVARLTHDGGRDVDLADRPGDDVREVDLDPEERVLASLAAGSRAVAAARSRGGAEEAREHVAEAAEVGEAAARPVVVVLALLWIAQD